MADTAWATSARVPDPAAGHDGGRRWAVLVLEPETASVARARRWARQVLAGWHADEQEWTLSQLLTEVVTNAVLHADTRFRVRLERGAHTDALRCEVTDTSAVRPRRRQHSHEATTGRGLQMVADLSRRWGVVSVDGGKTVWFEVDPDADLRLTDGVLADDWLDVPDVAPTARPAAQTEPPTLRSRRAA
jgi:anti-sigma regulatory factor (Ser/Thr protein kinase)